MNTITTLSQRVLLVAALFVAAFAVKAQDESPLTISGSIDSYYRVNLNGSNKTTNGGTVAPGTSFANLPGFSLGMANLIVGHEGEKSGFVADLVFGPRGAEAVFGSVAPLNIVNQLYAYWNVSDAFTLTLGNFNTFLGYEVISPTANFNYSTSYMFSYGPFSHSGVKADIALGDDATLMLGLLNPTDITDFNPTADYLGGAQLGVGGQYLNLLFGEDYFQIDYTGGLDLGDATFLGINATYNNNLFAGAALYLQQSFSDDFSLGLRGEYFQQIQSDEDEIADAFGNNSLVVLSTKDASVVDLTLSANYKLGNLTLIPEFRVDLYSEDEVQPSGKGAAQGSLASLLIAAVYAF